MPTFLLFHKQYWEFTGGPSAPVATRRPGYPTWQASVITPSLFGIVGAWLDVWMARLKWWWQFAPRLHRLTADQRHLLLHVLTHVESPGYFAARQAVRDTAVILEFNKPDAWTMLKHGLRADPGEAENCFRHLEAIRRLRETGASYTNPQAHLLTELAYQDFALHPRRR